MKNRENITIKPTIAEQIDAPTEEQTIRKINILYEDPLYKPEPPPFKGNRIKWE